MVAAESTFDGWVYRPSATGGGNVNDLCHDGTPTVEFGFRTGTAHAVDEYTTVDAYARPVGEFVARIDDGAAGSDNR